MIEGATGRHGEDQATNKNESRRELNEAGTQRASSLSVELGAYLLKPTRWIWRLTSHEMNRIGVLLPSTVSPLIKAPSNVEEAWVGALACYARAGHRVRFQCRTYATDVGRSCTTLVPRRRTSPLGAGDENRTRVLNAGSCNLCSAALAEV